MGDETEFTAGDVFDLRTVFARVEYIEGLDEETDEDKAELAKLLQFLESVKGCGGDEQWRGDWYPLSFIADSYFEQYARDFAEDIGAIQKDMTWPYTCIDWEKAVRELQMDYNTVEYEGRTYWYN